MPPFFRWSDSAQDDYHRARSTLKPRNLIGWLQLMHSGIVPLIAEHPFTERNLPGSFL
jgi:hypothetical protein